MADFVVDKKKIARNTMVLYVRMAFTMVVSFFTARVTLQQLGVDDYGLNNLVGSVVSLLAFLQNSMGTAVQRFYSIEIGQQNVIRLKKVFSTALFLHISIAIITLGLAEVFAVFILSKMNIPAERLFAAHVVFQISSISLFLSIVSVPYAALLRAREDFDKMAMIEIVQSLLRLGILYLLVHVNYDKLITLSLFNFSITIICTSAMIWLAMQYNETHSRPYKVPEIFRQMMSFVSMLLVSTLASLAKTKGLVLLINLFFGLAINAAYAIAVQVSTVLQTFVANFKSPMVPQLMAAYGAGDRSEMIKIINTSTKVSAILMLLITMPVIFEAKSILELWLGEPPQYSAELVSLVLININISQLTFFHYQGIHATGKITLNQTILTCLSLIAILLIFLSFKLGFSFFSAMYINMIVSVLIVANGIFFSRRNYNYSVWDFLSILARLLFVVALTIVCILSLKTYLSPSFARLIVVLCATVFLLSILSFSFVFSKEERAYVKNVIRVIRKK